MHEHKHISSAQNPLIKKAVLLKDKARERKKTGLFLLEGLRELSIAIKAEYEITTIFYCADIFENSDGNSLLKDFPENKIISVSHEIYKKLAYRDTTEGILAIAKGKDHTLSTLAFNKPNPLILVAEAPEKPGNIGALLRTADAANLDAVFIANPKTDLYNPNIIRSSVGCVFSRTIKTGSTQEIISYLQQERFGIFCAALTASKEYTSINYTGPTAIVVGTEHDGLSKEWLSNSTQNIIIPMEGEIDSMNVSVSAAILIFEVKRQQKLGR
ncbi:RNA methyltransferase, TrmH family [Maribacter sedimenticola]|uniref:RNA methyltransferase, TrmH family n=1 Tax=Maribacter sedimenticola TaxID=228956 RepID=A0ABY1SK64_9FLAO|nr:MULTISPECIES: RNA methyltransferase [Maribacter]TVZ17385.1 TrmH family RNA methyltransferase [Maribacter sp. MAR_2009_72]SNR68302.1 RNA methyltransferase, TrmH family [Maribacter sedimenticola]